MTKETGLFGFWYSSYVRHDILMTAKYPKDYTHEVSNGQITIEWKNGRVISLKVKHDT